MQSRHTNHRRTATKGLLLMGAFVLLVVLIVAVARRDGGPSGEAGSADTDRSSAPGTARAAAASRASISRSAPGASVQTTGPRIALRTTWGTGPRQLGRKQAAESAPEGPASFIVDDAGRAFVLDQVNLRIQVYKDGKRLRSIPLPADTFEDIALMPDGSIAVLDRFSRKTVRVMDAQGQLLSEVNLEGPSVSEGGAVTGLFARDDGLWVEVAHGRLVRITDASGQADAQRPWEAGRFMASSSKVLSAALDGRYAAKLITRPAVAGKAVGQRLARVEFDQRLAHLTALESDAAGNVYLGALTVRRRQSAPYDVLEQRSQVVIVSAAGQELRRVALPAPVTALEFLRSVRVSPNGTIWHLAYDAQGATLRRYSR